MPNKAAKMRKQNKLKLNKKWAKEGRTSNQHKKWLAKDEGKKVKNRLGR